MNGNFQTDGIYPFSTEPAEGYGSDPLSRKGGAVITHVPSRQFVSIIPGGLKLVETRAEATQFKDYSEASIRAGELKEAERAAA